MARIRSIHPGLFTDEAYMQMSLAAKAAWPALWTECDDYGAFEWKPIVLKARIFPADAVDFAAVLAELEALDCIRKIEIDGKPVGLVRNFGKFQRPKKPQEKFALTKEAEIYVAKPKDKTPKEETGGEPVGNRGDTGTEKPPQMEKEKEDGGCISSSHSPEREISDCARVAGLVEEIVQSDDMRFPVGLTGGVDQMFREGFTEPEILSAAHKAREGGANPSGWKYIYGILRNERKNEQRNRKPRQNPADASSPDATSKRRAGLAAGAREAFPWLGGTPDGNAGEGLAVGDSGEHLVSAPSGAGSPARAA